MRLSLLVLLPLLAPQAAFAESWRAAAYSSSPTPMVYFVDVDSVQRSGNKVTFRQQTVYSATSATRDFDRTVTTRDADCVAVTSSMRDSSFYVAGKFLDTEAGPGNVTTAQPGSILLQMINAVCGRVDYLSPVLTVSAERWAQDRFRSGQ